MKQEQLFELSASTAIIPILDYSGDSLSLSLFDYNDSLMLMFRSAPSLIFFAGRNESYSKAAVTGNRGSSLKTESKEVHYPLGVYVYSNSYVNSRIPMFQLQQIQLDFENREWEMAVGFRDSSYFSYKFEFLYRTLRLEERVVLQAEELEPDNPFYGASDSRNKQWSYYGSFEFPLFKVGVFYQLSRDKPEKRQDEDFWITDSSRSCETGVQYVHKAGAFSSLELHFITGAGNNTTEGLRTPNDISIKRFHYGRQSAVWNRSFLGKRWTIQSKTSRAHQFQTGLYHFFYRGISSPLSVRDAEDGRKETFSYKRFNLEWFTREYGFLGFYGDKYELIGIMGNVYGVGITPGYSVNYKRFQAGFVFPVTCADLYGQMSALSSETGEKDALNKYIMSGKVFYGTPSFTGSLFLNNFIFDFRISHILPLYTDLTWKNEKTNVKKPVKNDNEKSGFSALKNGGYASAGMKIFF